jgi:hypothetical protein
MYELELDSVGIRHNTGPVLVNNEYLRSPKSGHNSLSVLCGLVSPVPEIYKSIYLSEANLTFSLLGTDTLVM